MSKYVNWDIDEESDKYQNLREVSQRNIRSSFEKNETLVMNAKTGSEILLSKNAVKELKLKRLAKQQNSVISDSTHFGYIDMNNNNSPTAMITIISDTISGLLKEVRTVVACADKNCRHLVGFSKGFKCIRHLLELSEKQTVLEQSIFNSRDECGTVLEVVKDLRSVQSFMAMQVANCLGVFAFSLQEYSLTAEVDRCVLLQQQQQQGNGLNNVIVHLWATRGLSFASIGSPYFANLHVRRVQNIQSDFYDRNIEAFKLLEAAEVSHARTTTSSASSDDFHKIGTELERCVVKFVGCLSPSLPDSMDLSKIDCELVRSLLYPRLHNALESFSLRRDIELTRSEDSYLYCDEVCERHNFDDAVDTQNTLDAMAFCLKNAIRLACSSQDSYRSAVTFVVQKYDLLIPPSNNRGTFSDEMHIMWSFYDMLRREFYEAQILFVESAYWSAQTKYEAVIVLIITCRLHIDSFKDKISVNVDIIKCLSDVIKYLSVLKSASMLNCADCKVRRKDYFQRQTRSNCVILSNITSLSVCDLCHLAVMECDTHLTRLTSANILARINSSIEPELNLPMLRKFLHLKMENVVGEKSSELMNSPQFTVMRATQQDNDSFYLFTQRSISGFPLDVPLKCRDVDDPLLLRTENCITNQQWFWLLSKLEKRFYSNRNNNH